MFLCRDATRMGKRKPFPWVETHGYFPTWLRHEKGIPHRIAVKDHSRGF
jgi:hypothetical protein